MSKVLVILRRQRSDRCHHMRRLALAMGLAGFLLSASDTAQAQSKCDARKTKETGKNLFCKAKVHATAFKRNLAPDGTKLASCTSKYTDNCAKAQTEGDCSFAGNCPDLEVLVDACVQDILDEIANSGLSKCDSGKAKETGRKVSCEAKVYATAFKNNLAPDGTKLASCTSKYTDKCANAEGEGDCSSAGNCPDLAAIVAVCVQDILDEIVPPSTTTTTTVSTTTTSTTTTSTTSTTVTTTTTSTTTTTTLFVGEFQVNTYTTDGQQYAAVAVDGAGNFVVVWESLGSAESDTAGWSIQGQRYDSSGTAQGSEFQVNSYTTSDQRHPAVAADAAGNLVVVWQSAGPDAAGLSIQGQRYDSSGVAQGSEFQVNTYWTSDQASPAVAADAAGNFVVVWYGNASAGSDTAGFSVHGQRYDSSGAAQGTEFQVNTYTTGGQHHPAVAADPAGNFLVVWDYGNFAFQEIQGQRYDSSGAAQGTEFQVNTYTTSDQVNPAVAADAAGNFVVVWRSIGSALLGGFSITGQRYDSSGTAQGGEFQANTYTNLQQRYPAVAADAAGNFVVVWQSLGSAAGSDTSSYSIQGQRFEP
jgi:hypothetical protein